MRPIVTDRVAWSVGRSVCHTSEPSKNGWTDGGVVWVEDSGGLRERRVRWRSRSPMGGGMGNLVASYDIRPGNGEGLFWFRRFINLSLAYLLRHLPTYLQSRDPHGAQCSVTGCQRRLVMKHLQKINKIMHSEKTMKILEPTKLRYSDACSKSSLSFFLE